MIKNLKPNQDLQFYFTVGDFTFLQSYESICVVQYKGYYFYTIFRKSKTTNKYINIFGVDKNKIVNIDIQGYQANIENVMNKIIEKYKEIINE